MKTENKIQSECYMWLHNSLPGLRGLLCYNLNNSKNKIDGAKNKALGVQAGRSDMVLYYQSKAYMLECKTPGGTQSDKQKEWEQLIKLHGFEYHIFRSLEEFQMIINSIL